MTSKAAPIEAYLEVGSKRVFAVAVDWPGWARSGRVAEGAVENLLSYSDRYSAAIGDAASLSIPSGVKVVERIGGNATTDFGAPGIVPDRDAAALDGEDLERQLAILRACWETLDRVADAAAVARLATGPRGGGRDLAAIVAHVLDAERAYARTVGLPPEDDAPVHKAFEAAVLARARGALSEKGPRGGKRWPARYAIRRAAWHVLDHAWEIEDRTP